MPQFSSEKYARLMEEARLALHLTPGISSRELGKALGIDYRVALKLKKKLERQRMERVKLMMPEEDLADLTDLILALEPTLRRLVAAQGKSAPAAYKAILEGRKQVVGLKMDMGIYKRNLGRITIEKKLTEEDAELIKQAIGYADDQAGGGEDTGKPDGEKAASSA